MIYLQFPLNQYNWDLVVNAANENQTVEHEGSTTFVVEYPTQEDADKAITRFDSNVDFKDVSAKQNDYFAGKLKEAERLIRSAKREMDALSMRQRQLISMVG